jgi:FkbM family methyltransferase
MKVVLDVGANDGDWALLALNTVPWAEIHCFEIATSTAAILRERTKNLPKIHVHPFGLAEASRPVTVFHYPTNSQLTSIVAYPHGLPHSPIFGRVLPGDTFVTAQSFARINLLKIDVEGSEPDVLRGFTRTLRAGRIDVIQFEYGQVNLLTGFLLRDFYKFLEQFDFVIGRLYPNYVDFRPYDIAQEDFRGPNFVAVRRREQALIKLLSG